MKIAPKTIGRLSLYRRLLANLEKQGQLQVFSHQLASLAGLTPAQVRRDLMHVPYSGSPAKGYATNVLRDAIGVLLDHPEGQNVALVGLGQLGKALLNHFNGRRTDLTIVAAFDNDSNKLSSKIFAGVRTYPMPELKSVVQQQGITIAILCVPADAGQKVANQLVDAGVQGIVNFVPVPLKVPTNIYVEDMDITMSLEKVAFYSRQYNAKKE